MMAGHPHTRARRAAEATAAGGQMTGPSDRPSAKPYRGDYTEAMGKRTCDLVAEGKGLGRVEVKGMPPRRTVRDWLKQFPEFRENYGRPPVAGRSPGR